MSAVRPTLAERATTDEFNEFIKQDPHEYGRHNARFTGDGPHLHPVLNALRRDNGTVLGGNVAEVAAAWHLSEEAVRAAVRYYERHRALYDAFFLLQDEEASAWNHG